MSKLDEVYAKLQVKTGAKLALIVLDGLGDIATREQGEVTPLEAANTPNLDALVRQGCAQGRMIPVAPGITPGSGPGHLALFGYDPLQFEVGRALLEALGLGGASFLSDLAGALGKRPEALVAPLRELLLAGLVSGDGFHGLRELLRARRVAPAAAAPPARFGAVPSRRELRHAESRVASRLGFGPRSPAAASHVLSGRWSLLGAPSVLGPELAPGERGEAWARLLLARWGVVSRTVVEEAESAVRWSDVAPALARMELRGDVRRGEFVEGDGPLQYAEPEVVEELRRMREARVEDGPRADLAALAGSDPALVGLAAPRDGWCVLSRGAPVAILSGAGALDLGAEPAPDRLLRAALAELQELLKRGRDPLGRPRRLVVATVASGAAPRPAAGSPIAPLLEGLGFTRDGTSYSWRAL